jgi:hypothetical protein
MFRPIKQRALHSQMSLRETLLPGAKALTPYCSRSKAAGRPNWIARVAFWLRAACGPCWPIDLEPHASLAVPG